MEWNLTELFNTEDDFYKEIENIKEKLKRIKSYETIELNKDNLLELLKKNGK